MSAPKQLFQRLFIFVIRLSLRLFMWTLRPIRELGVFGTPENPKYIYPGDKIPVWVIASYPFNIMTRAKLDLETYYDAKDGEQMIRPLFDKTDGKYITHTSLATHIVFTGAPTVIFADPRNDRPSRRHHDEETTPAAFDCGIQPMTRNTPCSPMQ